VSKKAAKKPTVRERRKECAQAIVGDIHWAKTKLAELEKALTQMKHFPSHNTGENRSYYLDKFNEAREAMNTATVRWRLLCELYDIVGDTKERAW